MLKINDIAEIRRLFHEGFSAGQIVQITGFAANTVSKYRPNRLDRRKRRVRGGAIEAALVSSLKDFPRPKGYMGDLRKELVDAFMLGDQQLLAAVYQKLRKWLRQQGIRPRRGPGSEEEDHVFT
jgi:hypothetical protein